MLYSFLSIFQLFGESLILFFLFRVMLEFGRKIGKIVSTGCSIVEESLILFFFVLGYARIFDKTLVRLDVVHAMFFVFLF